MQGLAAVQPGGGAADCSHPEHCSTAFQEPDSTYGLRGAELLEGDFHLNLGRFSGAHAFFIGLQLIDSDR